MIPAKHQHKSFRYCFSLELRCIWRNRRPRKTLFSFMLLFLCVHLFLNLIPALRNTSGAGFEEGLELYIFMSFTSGGIAIFFGIFLIPWSSPYIYFILSKPFSVEILAAAKFGLLSGLVVLFSVLSIGSVLALGYSMLPYIVIALWHLTWTASISLLVTSRNRERVDLQIGTFKNFQAYGVAHFILMWTLIALPAIMFYLLSGAISPGAAGATIIILSGTGVLISPAIIRVAARNMVRQGRVIAESSFLRGEVKDEGRTRIGAKNL